MGEYRNATARTPKAQAVLDAASELFYSHGIHAIGVDTIAEHAGVTKKTLYDRFGSKDRLVAEYLSARDASWQRFLSSRLDAAGPDPERRLGAVFTASADWAAEHGGRGCSMINAFAEISDADHPANAVIARQKRWMLELFTEIADAGGAADPQRTASAIMLLHEGAIVTHGMHVVPDAFAHANDLAESILRTAARSD